jgi:glycerophosphoryl diester phosphodiesterase
VSIRVSLDKGLEAIEQSINLFYSKLPQPTPNAAKANIVKLVAHRGAHDHANGIYENTFEAIEEAVKLGCWGVEFDVRTTKDGIWVVHHDNTLERLWNLPHALNELTYYELKNIAPQIPRLEDVLERYAHQIHCFIELKEPVLSPKALKILLQNYRPKEDYHLISLSAEILAGLDGMDRDMLFLVPIFNVETFCRISVERNYAGVLGHFLMFRDKYIEQLRNASQKVGVGIVDSKMSLYRELNRDVDWIFTNQAAQMSSLLKNLTK